MSKTSISWTRGDDGTKGETWNPITGCTKISAGCTNCYAERMTKRLAAMGTPKYAAGFDTVVCHEEELDRPLHWKKPRRIFVCSMSDLFHEDVPDAFIERVFDVMHKCKQHTFQVLTKRPRRMVDMVRKYSVSVYENRNIHYGVTVESRALSWRIGVMHDSPLHKQFVSFEPLVARADSGQCLARIDWAIIGCESGPGARPMRIEWALDIVGQCTRADVAVFVKQLPDPNGRVVKFKGGEWPDWVPAALRRQEFPKEVGR